MYSTGKYACAVCYHSGERLIEKKCVRIRYTKEQEAFKLRTHSETVTYAHAAQKSHGVKGFSCLMVLPDFDIIKGVATDYMHNVLLGVVKRLIGIWFGDLKIEDSKFKTISKQNQIHLVSLKPYSRITQKPRSLEYRSQYRAIEYKYMLFYYLRYALNGILDNRYIEHFELLSAAIYILCKSEIKENEIKLAERMLNEFCDLFEELYGNNKVTMNVHLLRHYGQIVRECGPSWAFSLFAFETNMGILSRYYVGGSNIIKQISEKYQLSVSLPTPKEEISVSNEKSIRNEKIFDRIYDDILREHNLSFRKSNQYFSFHYCV